MQDETSKWLMGDYIPPASVGTDQASQETRVEGTGDKGKPWRNSIGERYKIRARIAETGASHVYEAWDEIRQMRVAIKELRLPDADREELDDLIARFEESAEITRHPKIVEVKKFLEIDGRYYIVMEFMGGGSLDDRIKRAAQHPLTIDEIETVMNDLFAALEHSHQSNIIHRDVKPANILLSSKGGWKLTDFGIARIMSSKRTQLGTFLGTPAYSSPEQVKGLLIDERTDIYSCGVVLYELLAGQRPFRGGADTVKRAIVQQEPVPPSAVGRLSSPALDKVVARAMAKDRDQRHETIAAFREAMTAALRVPDARLRGLSNIKTLPPFRPTISQFPSLDALADPGDRLNMPWEGRRKPRQGSRVLAVVAALIFLSAAGYAAWRALPGLLPPAPDPQSAPYAKPVQERPRAAPSPVPASPGVEPTPPSSLPYTPSSPPNRASPVTPAPSPVEPSETSPTGTGGAMPAPSSRQSLESEPAPPVSRGHESRPNLPLPPSYATPAPSNPGGIAGRQPNTGNPGKPNPLLPRVPPKSGHPGGKASPEAEKGASLLPPSLLPDSDLKPTPFPPDKPSAEPLPKPGTFRISGREVGLLCAPVTAEQAQYLNIPDTDVPLVQVQGATNGLAADKAGIRSGDVLQKTGDLSTRSEFSSQCLVTPNGGRAVVKAWRNHAWKPFTLQVN